MSRIKPLKREDVAEFEDLWTQAEAKFGYVPNSLLLLARRPDILRATQVMSKAVYTSTEVPQGLKRLIAHVASKTVGCQYCSAHTADGAADQGIDDAKIKAVFEYETSPLFTPAERAALALAQAACTVPNAVTDADFAELRKHYSEAAIIEIVAMIAWFGWWNRWNDILATPLEAKPQAIAERLLAETGWNIGKHAS